MPQALIVEDDPSTLMLVSDFLEGRGFETRTATSLAQARDGLERSPDLCICDIDLPRREGLQFAEIARAQDVNLVIVTGDPDASPPMQDTERSMSRLLIKPLNRMKLDRVLARFRIFTGRAGSETSSPLIGASDEIVRLRNSLARIGPSDATVLIVGESGTG
jgi:DNA-binding NtrC family response regulator